MGLQDGPQSPAAQQQTPASLNVEVGMGELVGPQLNLGEANAFVNDLQPIAANIK